MNYKVFWSNQTSFNSKVFSNKKTALNFAGKKLGHPSCYVKISVTLEASNSITDQWEEEAHEKKAVEK